MAFETRGRALRSLRGTIVSGAFFLFGEKRRTLLTFTPAFPTRSDPAVHASRRRDE